MNPRIDVDIAIVVRGGHILVCQHRFQDPLGGYWEFPGGKRHPGETGEACVAREVLEEVGLRVRAVTSLDPIDHDYPHGRIRLHPYLCEHLAGEPQLLACRDARWVQPRELPDYRFPPANEPLLQQVIERVSNTAES